jgi:3-phosphoshikimate 1-carboxyvinyltransferase
VPHQTDQKPLQSRSAGALEGTVRVPGDKSISHRALILGALSVGETTVQGLLEGDDVLATASALRALGAGVTRDADGTWRVRGLGVGGLHEPASVLDLGNAGTGARLLMGVVASHGFTSFFTGDASLCRRPMGRVAEPLGRIGAKFVARNGIRMPLAVIGTAEPLPIEYRLPVASAQVKSAVLLAGLNTPGETSVIEPEPTRDHTENMLRHFGAVVNVTALAEGGRKVTLIGQPELSAAAIRVPGDPSSAAFAAVAAAIRPGSAVRIENVGINPLRAGLFTTLQEMGVAVTYENRRDAGGEPVADLLVEGGTLKGITVPAERAPSMIDEYPVLCIAAALAEGTTVMRGIQELRVKESDRIGAMAAGLAAAGVRVEELPDGLVVHGSGGAAPAGGNLIETHMDHRIAMSFLVLGLASREPVTIDDGSMIDTSFPGFARLMNALGAEIAEPRP